VGAAPNTELPFVGAAPNVAARRWSNSDDYVNATRPAM